MCSFLKQTRTRFILRVIFIFCVDQACNIFFFLIFVYVWFLRFFYLFAFRRACNCSDDRLFANTDLIIAPNASFERRSLKKAREICLQHNATLPVIYSDNSTDQLIEFLRDTFFVNSTEPFVNVWTNSSYNHVSQNAHKRHDWQM